eukprot:m.67596 g.67596  ORF g.67596 m.67596 type:complete len:734 (-) comp8451_c0_seq1:138-2339(-)
MGGRCGRDRDRTHPPTHTSQDNAHFHCNPPSDSSLQARHTDPDINTVSTGWIRVTARDTTVGEEQGVGDGTRALDPSSAMDGTGKPRGRTLPKSPSPSRAHQNHRDSPDGGGGGGVMGAGQGGRVEAIPPRPTVADIQPYVDALVKSVSDRVGPKSALSVSVKFQGLEIQVTGTPDVASSLRQNDEASGTLVASNPTNVNERDEDVVQIKQSLSNAPHLPVEHSFFLSHVQREAGDVNHVFSLLLQNATDMPCWIDQKASTINLKTMVHGIAQSAVFMATLTKSYFQSKYCVFELRAARYLKKTIVMVHESDERHAGYATFRDYWAHAPPDLSDLCDSVTSRAIRRKGYEVEALVQDIVREVRPELDRAEAAKKPLQVLGPEVGGVLRELGETAACYVDLGSGQTMVYLLAIASDMSLEYQLVWELKECFIDMSADAREQVRSIAVSKFASIPDRLQALGTSQSNLFHVGVGATATYRVAAESGPEGQARVDEVEAWFRSVIADAHIVSTPDRVTFDTLVPRDEAMFEWLAVKTACTEMFGFTCDAVIAGGSGSVQVSMENEFISASSNLKEATLLVSESGISSYQQLLRQSFEPIFTKIADRLLLTPRSPDRPLRLVLISSFYYAAVACKVAQKGEYPRYRDVDELTGPTRALLGRYEQGDASALAAKDAANVTRLLALLDIVTSRDYHNVEVLIVREWTVRKKEYKATWTTGKFLHDIRIKVLEHRRRVSA